jgi:hypothetical protein
MRAAPTDGFDDFVFLRLPLDMGAHFLEGELTKRFPGQPKRVAAFLEATKPRHKRSRLDDDSNNHEG